MTTEEKIIKNKIGLIKLAHTLGNVSQACKVMGYSRGKSLSLLVGIGGIRTLVN